MRICVIRGRNLASLAEPFEVDFTRPPLDAAGLFAITGPTGAGKSTLLDAMFLALFDKTPRLVDRGGVEIVALDDPNQKLSSTDVRSLVPKGATEAFAEVEFVGTDGRRYRSTWRTRRARARASGALQPQTLELRDVAEDRSLGGKKTETLEAIRSRLGLDFEQFRRSVVLAQGEFAAFLRAKQDDRAELLERMTGTHLYTAISARAYARAKAEEEALGALRVRRDAVQPMPYDARAALDADIDTRMRAIDALGAQLADAERAVAWHERMTHLSRAAEEARTALARTAQAFEAATSRRAALERVRAASQLRDAHAAAAEAESSARRAADARPGLEDARRAAEAELARANHAYDGARDALERALRAREELEAELRAARTLDVRIAAKREEHTHALCALEDATAKHDASSAARDALERAQAEHRARADALRSTSARLATLAPLVNGWAVARRALEALAKSSEDVLAALPDASLSIADALAEAERRAGVTSDDEAACERDLADAVRAIDPAEEAAIAEARARLETRAKRLDACALAHAAWREATESRDGAMAAARTAREAHAAFVARADAAAASLVGVMARRSAVESLLDELRAIESLAMHRHLLRDHEPCPLCGATEHPGATDTSVVGERITAYVHEARALDAEALTLREAQRAYTLDAERAAIASESHDARAAEAAARSESERASWARLVEDGPDVEETAVGAWLTTITATIGTDREGIEARAAAHAKTLRNERARRAALTEAQTRARAADKVLAFERTLAAHAETLAPIDGARSRLLERPTGFIARLDEEVATFHAVERERAVLVAEDAALRDERTKSDADLARCAQEADTHATRARALEDALRSLEVERNALLGGAAADAFERALADAITAARTAYASAEEARTEAARAHEALVRSAELGAKDAELLAAEASRARERLARACMERGLDADTLDALLAHPTEWLSAEADALEAIAREHADATTRLADRLAAQRAHASTVEVDASAADALVAHDTIRATLADEQGALGALRERAREDDARRDRDLEAVAAIDAQARRTEVWNELREVIGSADGSKFRKYAQSLTFDALLDAANVHLRELAPRYALMSVPGHDLELQLIDHDLADEVRAVTSLSGGESFLVSLALALGLSSLGNAGTRIDSLFIDEGFGALDMKSLDAALGVLEALQATGRKVGIIAHAPGLETRVGAQIRVIPTGSGRSRVEIAR